MKIRKATVVTNDNVITYAFPGTEMDYFYCNMIISYRDSEEIRNKNDEEVE